MCRSCPQRGPGADMIGRTLGLLSGPARTSGLDHRDRLGTHRAGTRHAAGPFAAATRTSTRWSRPGTGTPGWPSSSWPGPYTIAAAVERKGRQLLADPGLVRDLIAAWRQTAAEHREELSRRVAATWLLQMDEPSLPTVVAGAVQHGQRYGFLPRGRARDLRTRGRSDPLLRRRTCRTRGCAGLAGLLFDLSLHRCGLRTRPWRSCPPAGTVLGFGVSPVAGSVRSVLDFFDRTGLPPAPMLVTPPCGMVADYRPWRPIVDDLTERLQLMAGRSDAGRSAALGGVGRAASSRRGTSTTRRTPRRCRMPSTTPSSCSCSGWRSSSRNCRRPTRRRRPWVATDRRCSSRSSISSG